METAGNGSAGMPGVPGDHAGPTEAPSRVTVRPWDKRCTLAFVAVLAVYLLVFWSLPPDVFWSPDEGAKVLQMRALGWQDGLLLKIPYPGSNSKYDL